MFEAQGSGFVGQHVDGQADAEVRAQRRIERQQHHLGRLAELHVVARHAVENGLAVFVLADLEERRIGRCLDEVAGGIDLEQARLLLADLAGEDEAGREGIAAGRQRFAVDALHLADGLADDAGGLEHGLGGEQVGRRGLARAVHRAFAQQADHRLGDGQIAGGEQHEDALAGLAPGVQLLELADIVDARIGARVGGHDEALVQQQSDAIGHRKIPEIVLTYCWEISTRTSTLIGFDCRHAASRGSASRPAASMPAATRT